MSDPNLADTEQYRLLLLYNAHITKVAQTRLIW
jgi:hypothetical protein